MDGVLVDSELHWKKVEFAFLNSLAPDFDMASHIGLLGMSVPDVFRLFKDKFHIGMGRDEFVRKYDEMAFDIYNNRTGLMPGCIGAMQVLKKSGFLVALATSSSRKWVDAVFERFAGQLDGVFDAVTSADDVEGEKKPAPAIYLHAANSLSTPPESCVAVEDAGNGILSAKRAGMKCIGYRNGFNDEQDLSKADFVMHGFGELTVEKLNALLEIQGGPGPRLRTARGRGREAGLYRRGI